MKKFLGILFTCIALLLCVFLVACGQCGKNNSNSPEEEAHLAKGIMNKSNLTLEKHETFVLSVEGNDSFIWTSTDESVASVSSDGTVSALSEGMAIIKATSETTEAKCLVKVMDNALVPQIITNVGSSELSLVKGDDFVLEYSVYYNKKLIDLDIDIRQEGDNNIITLETNKINANNYGSVRLVLFGEWSGISVMETIEVNVVADMVASISDIDEITLYNDERAGDTSVLIVPKVIENGIILSSGQIDIVDCVYDEDIISYDIIGRRINAVKKGRTDVVFELKSLATGNTIMTSISLVVELYNEDKSSDIRIRNAYQSDGIYLFYLSEIFKDKAENEYKDLKITYAADITDVNVIDLNVADGKIDVSKVGERQLLGERKWYVECEKFARTVSVTVNTENYEKLISGIYFVEETDFISSWKNNLILSQIDGINRFEIINPISEDILYSGTYRLEQWTRDEKIGGHIILDKVGTQTNVHGYYWESGGMIYIDMRIDEATNYAVNYYRKDKLPYKAFAGEYTSSSWAKQIFVLNEDGTCVFDNYNNLSARQTGVYSISPDSITSGMITMTFETGFNGQTNFYCSYKLKDGKYTFIVSVGTNQLTYVQASDRNGPYTEIAGYYSSGDWLYWKLNLDGTVIFDYRGTDKILQKVGKYTLTRTDATSGNVKFVFNKDYCGYYEHEGEYYINNEGKYVFTVYVFGSGSATNDIRTFTQQINLINES